MKQADEVRGMQSLYILEGLGRRMQRLWVKMNQLWSRRIHHPLFENTKSGGILKGMPFFWGRVDVLRHKFFAWQSRLPNRNLNSEGFTQWLVVHYKLKQVYPGIKELLTKTKRLLDESECPILKERFANIAKLQNQAVKKFQKHFKHARCTAAERSSKRNQEVEQSHTNFVEMCRKWWKKGRIQRERLDKTTQLSEETRSGSESDGPDIALYDPYVAAFSGGVKIKHLDDMVKEMRVSEKHRGWTVNSKSSDGETLLHNACLGGHADIARRLVELGASVNQISDSLTRMTPLMLAARRNSVPVMKMLLKNGAVPDAADSVGDTALHWSTRHGRVAATKFLLGQQVFKFMQKDALPAEEDDLYISLDAEGPATDDPMARFVNFIQARNLRGRCACDLTERKIIHLIITAVENEYNDKLSDARRAHRLRLKQRSKKRPFDKANRVHPAGKKGVINYINSKREEREGKSDSPNQEPNIKEANKTYQTEKLVLRFLDTLDTLKDKLEK